MRRTLLGIIFSLVLAMQIGAGAAPAGQVTKTELPNGLVVLVKPEPGAGLVAIEAFIKAGAAQERTFEAGIGKLVAKTLLASTRNLRAEKLAQIADEVGGNFESIWHRDYSEIRAVTTSGRFDEAIGLLGDVLTNARFDAPVVDRARVELLGEAENKEDEIFQTAYDEICLQLYRDSPYRRPDTGYPASVRKLNRESVEEFYRKFFVPNNMVISIVGDVTVERATERIRMAFAGTGKRDLPVDRGVPDETMPKSRSRAMERNIRLAYIMIGFLAPGVGSPDYPAMAVANAALGAGKGSRLFQNLRERRGIAYELGTIYPRLKYQSHLLAYLITDPFKIDLPSFTSSMALEEAKQALLDEVNALQEKPLSDEELTRAKRYCIGSYALEHQRLRDRAYLLGWLEAIGVGYQFDNQYAAAIEAVTKADVQRVVSKYLTNYALVIILPKGTEPGRSG